MSRRAARLVRSVLLAFRYPVDVMSTDAQRAEDIGTQPLLTE